MINKALKFKTKEEWLESRGKSIGGSSIATILGLNPYESPYDLWLKLTDREPPVVENNNMVAGRFLEKAVGDWFEYETGHHVVKASEGDIIMEHPVYPFIKASPDRKVFLNGSRKLEDTAILEIKTTGMNIDPDDIPPSYYVQGMMYAGFWEFPKVIVCWYDRIRNNIDYKVFDFDKEIFNTIIEETVHFWNNYVLLDVPPPATTSSDVSKRWPDSKKDKTIIATDEILEFIYSPHCGIKRELKEISNKDKEIATKVKLIMKDSEYLVTPQMETLYTFKSGSRARTLRLKEI